MNKFSNTNKSNKNRARVLLVTRSFVPIFQGESVNYSLLSKGIDPRKIKLFILTSYWMNEKLISNYGNATIFRMLLAKSSAHYQLKPNVFNKYLFYFLSYISLFVVLPLLVIFYKINIIHITHGMYTFKSGKYLNWPLLELLKIIPVKIIADIRIEITTKINPKYFDGVICNSENISKYIVSSGFNNKTIHFVHSPILTYKSYDNLKMSTFLNSHKPYIAFVGAISERKCIYELIDGFRHFRKKNLPHNFLLAGPNAESEKFLTYINNDKKIHYLGMLGHQDALQVIKECALLLIASNREGIPRVCLEAISLKRKVLLPKGINEFNVFCKDFVLEKTSAAYIANKIAKTLEYNVKPEYPYLKDMTLNNYIMSMTNIYQSYTKNI